MRWCRLAVVLGLGLGLSGCYTGRADDGSAGDAGTGVCDNKQDCSSCLSCARSGPCAQLLHDCVTDAACAAVDQCVAVCGADLECRDQCFINNPAGVAPYRAAETCLYCTECRNDCAGYLACD